jgi:hypothetical protein
VTSVTSFTSSSAGYGAKAGLINGTPDPTSTNGSHITLLGGTTARAFVTVPNDRAAYMDQVYANVTWTGGNPTCTVCGAAGTLVVTGAGVGYAYADGPDLSGIDTTNGSEALWTLSSINTGANATRTACAVTCTGDDAAPVTLNYTVAMADGGVIDTTAPAAGGAVTINGFGYCGATAGDDCDTASFGGTGWASVSWYIHFDPAILTSPANCSGGACPVSVGTQGGGEAYGFPVASTTQRSIFNETVAGTIKIVSDSVGVGGWNMANLTRVPFTASAQAAGTVTLVDISQWSSSAANINSSNEIGCFVNGSNDCTAANLPITNKSGRVRYQ